MPIEIKNNFSEFKNKKVVIADVDETICESCSQISDEMTEQITSMSNAGYAFVFISGTHIPELMRMISSKLKNKHYHMGNTGAQCALIENDESEQIHDYAFGDTEKKEICSALEKLTIKFNLVPLTNKEDQIQDRGSQVTLSILGRNAPKDQKASYDPSGDKRQKLIKFLRPLLPEKYDLKIGGTTSIDVIRKDLNKGAAIKDFSKKQNIPLEDIVFFGDKIYPGGNDYEASRVVDYIHVKNPQETLTKLKKIFK